MEEQVQLYDASGSPSGTAPRSLMRAQNLPHAATGVVVRDRLGRVYAHQRTPIKDVYPSRWDFTAGGVLAVGEQPDEAAVRELAEELGITGVELTTIGRGHYADDHTDYWGFLYTCTWDGEIRWQPEEVIGGEWLSIGELLRRIDAAPEDWMPDAVSLLGDWLRERHDDRRVIEGGWDSDTTLVEDRWIDRSPKRPEVRPALLAETRLLPRLAERLPVAVPLPEVINDDPLTVRHLAIPGEPAERAKLTQADGELIGRFLRALHDTPIEVYADPDLPTTHWSTDAAGRTTWTRFNDEVLPLLTGDDHARASELLDHFPNTQERALIHGDLGPSHLLCNDGHPSGVIDWSDAALLDPAKDLCWVLWGGGREWDEFAQGVAAAYQPTPEQLDRSLAWHRLGPWYEVLWGIDQGDDSYIRSGLDGIRSRLPS